MLDELLGARYFSKIDFKSGTIKLEWKKMISTRRPLEHTQGTMSDAF
jgi:hypothetical protein